MQAYGEGSGWQQDKFGKNAEDSDVDICVCYMPIFFYDLSMSGGLTKEDVGITDLPHTYAEFKNEVGAALVAKFGGRGVTRGNKAFDVHESTARVDADLVPCFEHRRYTRRTTSPHTTSNGTPGGSQASEGEEGLRPHRRKLKLFADT